MPRAFKAESWRRRAWAAASVTIDFVKPLYDGRIITRWRVVDTTTRPPTPICAFDGDNAIVSACAEADRIAADLMRDQASTAQVP